MPTSLPWTLRGTRAQTCQARPCAVWAGAAGQAARSLSSMLPPALRAGPAFRSPWRLGLCWVCATERAQLFSPAFRPAEALEHGVTPPVALCPRPLCGKCAAPADIDREGGEEQGEVRGGGRDRFRCGSVCNHPRPQQRKNCAFKNSKRGPRVTCAWGVDTTEPR